MAGHLRSEHECSSEFGNPGLEIETGRFELDGVLIVDERYAVNERQFSLVLRLSHCDLL